MKGLIVTTGMEVKEQEFTEPLFQSIHEAIGGYMEIVRPRGLKRPYVMIVDDEGLCKDLPRNLVGCDLYRGYVVGDIVFMREDYGPEGPDLFGLTEEDIAYLKPFLKMIISCYK